MTEECPPKPTDAELAILRILWARGPSTVRHVQEELNEQRSVGYTTALKLLQIMHEKGLVQRDESRRTHVYRARHSREKTQNQLVGDLLERAFGGSASTLVLRALSSQPIPKGELEEIRGILRDIERG